MNILSGNIVIVNHSANTYFGDNNGKISVVIAKLGNPVIVSLNEAPTANDTVDAMDTMGQW